MFCHPLLPNCGRHSTLLDQDARAFGGIVTAQKGAATLEAELRTYRSHHDELIGRAKGKFVLIKGDKIVDIFENQTDAISNGFRKFGNHPFLVKQVTDIDVPVSFTDFNFKG
jgi:hypothetical protein